MTRLESSRWDYVNYAALGLLAFVMLFPFVYVFANSVSDPTAVAKREVVLLPIGFTLRAYEAVFAASSILRGFYNSVLYATLGTLANLLVAIAGGYVLSERRFRWRARLGAVLAVTLFLNAGLIPTFITYSNYGLVNSIFAMIVPWAFSYWEIVLVRTQFQSIPQELKDAARVDGASDIYLLARILVPLSKATIAVVALFTSVDIWNNFFTPFIYLNETKMQPLTVILHRVLVQGALIDIAGPGMDSPADIGFFKSVQMATIVVAVTPILLIYPFVQRYFVRGVLIGSLKG